MDFGLGWWLRWFMPDILVWVARFCCFGGLCTLPFWCLVDGFVGLVMSLLWSVGLGFCFLGGCDTRFGVWVGGFLVLGSGDGVWMICVV